MVIQHNMVAMFANYELKKSNSSLKKSTEKLSSGYKINRAGDDAARLAISEKMRGQIRGLDQSVRNAEDGISLVQTADGAMGEIESIVHRMRELAVQAANDTNTTEDRESIQEEIDQLTEEITRTADDTEFNTRKILKGSKQMKTHSVTGTIDDLRKVYQTVKNVQRIETVISEEVKVPGGYTKSSMPGWALGTDPLYIPTDTTTTGNLTEQIDLGEKDYYYQVRYKKEDGTSAGSSTTNRSNYESTQHLTKAELYTDSNGVQKVTQTFADGTTSDVEFSAFSAGNYYMARLLSQQPENVDGKKILTCEYQRTEQIITHNGGIMDFSNLNKNNITDLVDGKEKHGFNATCTACDKHYSISFVAGTGSRAYSVPNEDSYIYEIDIQELLDKASAGQDVTGEDLVDKVLNELKAMDKNYITGIESDYATFSNNEYESQSSSANGIKFQHHQALLKDDANPNALVFIDTWNYSKSSTSATRGLFDTTVYEGADTKTIWKRELANINLDNPVTADPNKIYTMYYNREQNDPLRIQVGANGGQELALTMPEISLEKLGIEELNVLTHADAAFSLDRCDCAIDYINSERGRMGAYQNRMEHILSGNSNTSENLQASESRMRDTDMAKEIAKFSKENILMQAGQSMLAQANQSKQSVLNLLG